MPERSVRLATSRPRPAPRRALWAAALALVLLAAGCGADEADPSAAPSEPAASPNGADDATPTAAPETDAGQTDGASATETAGEDAPLTTIRAHAGALVFGFAPFYLALDEGLFEEHGLVVELTTGGGGTQAVQALVGGDVELGLQTTLEAIEAERSDAPAEVRTLVPMLTQLGSTLTLRGEVAERLGLTEESTYEERAQALEGLTIAATSPGAATDQLVRYIAQDAGIDPDSAMNIAYVGGGAEMLAAFDQGAVDGFVISPPSPQIAVAQSDGFIAIDTIAGDIPSLDGFQAHSIAVNLDDVEARPEIYEGFVAAMGEALQALQEDPERAKEPLRARFSDMDADVFEATFDAMLPSFARVPIVDPDHLTTTLEFLATVAGDDSYLDMTYDDLVHGGIAEELGY